MPPPVTRSSSAMPVEKRGASCDVPASVSSVTTRPRLDFVRPEPGTGATASASSAIVFHSLQLTHFPDQRLETAPQFWQTKLDLAGLAMGQPRSR